MRAESSQVYSNSIRTIRTFLLLCLASVAFPALAIAPETQTRLAQWDDNHVGSLKIDITATLATHVPQLHIDPQKAEIEAYIKEVFGKASEEAIVIAKCESGLNPKAVNWGDAKITGKPSMGIFQLNRPYDEKYFDWRYNIETAYKEFYVPRGWVPWSCARITGII